MAAKRIHTDEAIADMLKMRAEGETFRDIGRKHGLSSWGARDAMLSAAAKAIMTENREDFAIRHGRWA